MRPCIRRSVQDPGVIRGRELPSPYVQATLATGETPSGGLPVFKLSQETIAILTIGLTILGTVLYTTGRIEDRIDRIQSEARADRAAWQEEIRILRVESRADRETFEKHITRLTQEQSRLTGIVEQMRTASR